MNTDKVEILIIRYFSEQNWSEKNGFDKTCVHSQEFRSVCKMEGKFQSEMCVYLFKSSNKPVK